MRRLFLDSLIQDEFAITGDDAKHLLYAMRVRLGQKFMVVDTAGKVANTQVISCTKDTVQMKFIDYVEDGDTEPPIEVVLAQCLPKADKMDYIVQKAVELGVNSIAPVVSRHCVVKYDAKKRTLRQQKWQKIADEAAKQCGRTQLPRVKQITELTDLVQKYKDYTCIVCYEAENRQTLHEVLNQVKPEQTKFLLLIGPEGGFSPEEIEICLQAGFNSISLGSRILRTETASLAALSIIMYEKGDL